MAIEPIASTAIAPALNVSGSASSAGLRGDFFSLVGSTLDQANSQLQSADAYLRDLAVGKNVPTHEVMIAMEQARMSLMLVTEVRNRLVEGYQELMRMQL